MHQLYSLIDFLLIIIIILFLFFSEYLVPGPIFSCVSRAQPRMACCFGEEVVQRGPTVTSCLWGFRAVHLFLGKCSDRLWCQSYLKYLDICFVLSVVREKFSNNRTVNCYRGYRWWSWVWTPLKAKSSLAASRVIVVNSYIYKAFSVSSNNLEDKKDLSV